MQWKQRNLRDFTPKKWSLLNEQANWWLFFTYDSAVNVTTTMPTISSTTTTITTTSTPSPCQCQSCWCDPLRDCILTFFGLLFAIFHCGLWCNKFMEILTNDSGYVIIGEDEEKLLKKLTNEAKSALTMMIFSIIFAVYLLVIQITCFTSFIAYIVSLTWEENSLKKE